MTIEAAGGTYQLRTDGFGIESGLAGFPHVVRGDGFAVVTLDYLATAEQVRARLLDLYGFKGIEVTETRTATTVTYRFTFVRAQAGRNLPPLRWAESRELTGLVPAVGSLVDVQTATIKDGYALNTVQTITVDATGGSFTISLLGRVSEAIPYDATALQLQRILDTILNPNNVNPALPFTDNVSVQKHGNDFLIVFQGEHSALSLAAALIDTTNLLHTTKPRGTVKLATRVAGINYYAIETLNIGLGSGDDVVNVRGTSAVTNLSTHDGDEQIYVSSDANIQLGDPRPTFLSGHLDDLDGTLNLYVGHGRHYLLISDEAAVAGDPNVLITDERPAAALRDADVSSIGEIFIVGLATGSITYAAEADASFADGITIWSGHGDDVISVDGTHERPGLRTATSLNTGLGDDTVTVALLKGDDGFFVLNTQGPYNHVLPLSTDISAGDHRTAADMISVYLDGNLVDIRLVAVDYARNTISLAIAAAVNSVATVIIHRLGTLLATESFRLPLMPTRTATSSTRRSRRCRSSSSAARTTTGSTAAAAATSSSATAAASSYVDEDGDVVASYGTGGHGDFTDGVIRLVAFLTSVDTTVGGTDVIETGLGADILFGGADDDTITTNRGETATHARRRRDRHRRQRDRRLHGRRRPDGHRPRLVDRSGHGRQRLDPDRRRQRHRHRRRGRRADQRARPTSCRPARARSSRRTAPTATRSWPAAATTSSSATTRASPRRSRTAPQFGPPITVGLVESVDSLIGGSDWITTARRQRHRHRRHRRRHDRRRPRRQHRLRRQRR